MPDRRKHRSAGPRDRELFAPEVLPRLDSAVQELSWLLTRGYAAKSSLKLVGDRYDLTARQREAVARCAAGEREIQVQTARRVAGPGLSGQPMAVDGFNVLTTLETALGGGLVLFTRDGCARDLAGLRGTWRRVAETEPAIELVGEHLAELDAGLCRWYLDAPVSNSGRLRVLLEDLAARRGWAWEVCVSANVDRELVGQGGIVASADRVVLGHCESWYSLAREICGRVRNVWTLDLSGPTTGC